MSTFDNLIIVDAEGHISFWIELMHLPLGLSHCERCLAINQCWFVLTKSPQVPQHEKCHCTFFPIPIPTIVNATCDIRKFNDYIFSEKYSWNGKRDLFVSLGFTIEDSEYLKNTYEKIAARQYLEGRYKLGSLDEQGQRINIDISFNKNGENITLGSGWMVRPKGTITNNTPLAN